MTVIQMPKRDPQDDIDYLRMVRQQHIQMKQENFLVHRAFVKEVGPNAAVVFAFLASRNGDDEEPITRGDIVRACGVTHAQLRSALAKLEKIELIDIEPVDPPDPVTRSQTTIKCWYLVSDDPENWLRGRETNALMEDANEIDAATNGDYP